MSNNTTLAVDAIPGTEAEPQVRRRGRPRKQPVEVEPSPPKKRGRPPKVLTEEEQEQRRLAAATPKKRGRPPKVKIDPVVEEEKEVFRLSTTSQEEKSAKLREAMKQKPHHPELEQAKETEAKTTKESRETSIPNSSKAPANKILASKTKASEGTGIAVTSDKPEEATPAKPVARKLTMKKKLAENADSATGATTATSPASTSSTSTTKGGSVTTNASKTSAKAADADADEKTPASTSKTPAKSRKAKAVTADAEELGSEATTKASKSTKATKASTTDKPAAKATKDAKATKATKVELDEFDLDGEFDDEFADLFADDEEELAPAKAKKSAKSTSKNKAKTTPAVAHSAETNLDDEEEYDEDFKDDLDDDDLEELDLNDSEVEELINDKKKSNDLKINKEIKIDKVIIPYRDRYTPSQEVSVSQEDASATEKILAPLGIKPYELTEDDYIIDKLDGQKYLDYMNDNQVAHIEKILLATKQQLLEQLEETKENLREDTENYADDLDKASRELDFAIDLRNRDRERRLIIKIDNTLMRLHNMREEFGYCESCGDEIGLRRLEARPTAELCINCKEKAEIIEAHHIKQD